jgi:serine/threonine protein phosphatase PrpC
MNKFYSETQIYEKLKEDNFEAIKFAFTQAEALLGKVRYDVNFSGTTSVMVFFIGNKIVCANSGDSRAMLVRNVPKIYYFRKAKRK